MQDTAAAPQTRRITVSTSAIGGAHGRETVRIPAASRAVVRRPAGPAPALPIPPEAAPVRHRRANREAAVMAEQRRLRRQLESALREQLLSNDGDHRGHHRLPALRTALGRPRLPVDAAHRPDEAHDWSRQTIVSEAVADYYPLVGYTTRTPPEEWARACLEPTLEADGAVHHSGQPFNEPKEGDADSSAYSRYLSITLRGRPGHGWLLLLERYGAAAAPASPWTDFDRELLEDSAAVWAWRWRTTCSPRSPPSARAT